MNQAIEAGLSGLASGIGIAILFGIGWLLLKAFHAVFSEPPKQSTQKGVDSMRKTTGIVERPYSKDESQPLTVLRPQGESLPNYESPKPPEGSSQRNRKIAAGIAILALIFVPTKFCGTYGCSTGGWQFIFDFDYNDQVDMQRMLIQLLVAGIVCWFILRRRDT
jgi:hypothetical protein